MLRACRANIVPCAITNRLRSFDSRRIRSCAKPPASGRAPSACPAPGRSPNGMTAMEARPALAGASRASSAQTAAHLVRRRHGGGASGRRRRPRGRDRAARHARAKRPPVHAFGFEEARSCARDAPRLREAGRAAPAPSARARAPAGRAARARATSPDGRTPAPVRRRRSPRPDVPERPDGRRDSAAAARAARLRSAGCGRSPVPRGNRRGTAIDRACSAVRSELADPGLGRRGRSTSTSTQSSDRSSRTASSTLWTRCRPGSSSTLRALLRRPAQFAARILRHVPEQFAQMSRVTARGDKREVGDQRAHLARGGQRQAPAASADGELPEQTQLQRGHAFAAARPIRFHGRFHAGYHVVLHRLP